MFHFSLSQLEALYWVARLGSFRAAADRLGLSQPSVTLRIRNLEKAINTTLFDRSGYRPTVTTEGAAVVRFAQQTLAMADKIQAFRENGALPARLLRFGMVDHTAMTKMPRLLDLFENDFPDLSIDLTVDYSARLNSLLAERRLDLAVLTEPKHHPGMETVAVGSVELTWAGSFRLDLPGRGLLPKDLVGRRIVTNPPPSNLHSSIVDWFSDADLSPDRISTCNTLHGIRQLIADGFAIGVLPTALLAGQAGETPIRALKVSRQIKAHRAYVAFNTDNSDSVLQGFLRKVIGVLGRE